MRPANELPNAAEKGALISQLATRGITGIDLATIAGKTRKEIAEVVKQRIRDLK